MAHDRERFEHLGLGDLLPGSFRVPQNPIRVRTDQIKTQVWSEFQAQGPYAPIPPREELDCKALQGLTEIESFKMDVTWAKPDMDSELFKRSL